MMQKIIEKITREKNFDRVSVREDYQPYSTPYIETRSNTPWGQQSMSNLLKLTIMVQYDERIQYDDLLACEYSSLFDCFFEISRPACDYYYPTNDGDYLVCTIHSTETKCTLLYLAWHSI